MRILAGLGNPGPRYAATRHNVGFMVVDAIHRRHGFAPWRSRFQADIAEGTLGGEKCLLIKPTTFMNESGRAIGEAMRYYKLAPADIVVFHDELDLPPGKMRVKTGGGHGGNNGLRSTIAHIGPDFHRVRIGIGHPGRKELVHGYILKDFAKADAAWLEPMIDALAEHAALLAAGKESTYANKVHLMLAPEAPEKPKKAKVPKAEAKAESDREKAEMPSDSAEPPEPAPKGGPFAALSKFLRR
ncbi:MAG: aminoacyl-tRNA hydrolase [Hyphomicrobiales bacterium]|nr:aminoacyl-tRNA hydrolase [Hyphomicrobiales bacterium]